MNTDTYTLTHALTHALDWFTHQKNGKIQNPTNSDERRTSSAAHHEYASFSRRNFLSSSNSLCRTASANHHQTQVSVTPRSLSPHLPAKTNSPQRTAHVRISTVFRRQRRRARARARARAGDQMPCCTHPFCPWPNARYRTWPSHPPLYFLVAAASRQVSHTG